MIISRLNRVVVLEYSTRGYECTDTVLKTIISVVVLFLFSEELKDIN